MGSGFLITLREGLEASLVLAILLSYVKKTDRWLDARYVWIGSVAAATLCVVAGAAIFVALDGLEGSAEQAVEGCIALFAMAVLTQMLFWMRSHARTLGKELREKVDRSTAWALSLIAFAAVAREGLETVLFLLSAETESASGSHVVIGGLLGLAVSALIGVAVYRSGNRLNLRSFFTVTAVLLLLFAAGLAGKAAHELRELVGWEDGWLVASAWNINSGPFSNGTFYDFVNGLFGWHSNPERLRVISYFLYLVPVLVLYFRDSTKQAPHVTATGTGSSAQVV